MDYLNEWMLLCGRRNFREKGIIQRVNNIGATALFNELCTIWCNSILWESEDNTIDVSWIEKTILFNSCVAFYELPGFGVLCGRANIDGKKTYYRNPNTVTIMDYNGKQVGKYVVVQRTDSEEFVDTLPMCALCFNDEQKFSPVLTIGFYAEQLGFIKKQINAAIRGIFGTTLIEGGEEQIEAIKRERMRASEGDPYIIKKGIKNRETSMLTDPFNIDILKTLFESYEKLYSEFLRSIGIPANSIVNKMSGVSDVELYLVSAPINAIMTGRLKARKDAIEMCEKIGITGLSAKVNPDVLPKKEVNKYVKNQKPDTTDTGISNRGQGE